MTRSFLYPLLGITLVGCASDLPRNMPLVFGESITFGVGIGTGTADQGVDLTLGFKSRDVAIIPVVAYKQDGTPEKLLAMITSKTASDKATTTEKDKKTVQDNLRTENPNIDAYSVLGQFSTETDGKGRRVGIGKFFSTGNAATRIAEGFQKCLGAGNCDNDNGKANAVSTNNE